jgi:hypothetical protein
MLRDWLVVNDKKGGGWGRGEERQWGWIIE